MGATARVTVTLPSELVEGIDHFFSDRRGHPLEAVKSARERPRGADGEDVDRP